MSKKREVEIVQLEQQQSEGLKLKTNKFRTLELVDRSPFHLRFGDQIKQAGFGTYGVVTIHRNRTTSEVVAIKTMSDVDVKQNELTPDFIREIVALTALDGSPNIIRMLAVNAEVIPTAIVMETAMCSLDQAIDPGMVRNSEDKPFQSREWGDSVKTQATLTHIMIGVLWMHSRGFAHRDLKPGNILIMHDGTAKIGDFGTSRVLPGNFKSKSMYTTLWWRSPEALFPTLMKTLSLEKFETWNIDALSGDMWSIGMCFYDMLAAHCDCDAKRYFQSSEEPEQLWKIIRGLDHPRSVTHYNWQNRSVAYDELSSRFPDCKWHGLHKSSVRSQLEKALRYTLKSNTWSLLEGLLNMNYHKRLTVEGAAHHPYFEGVLKEPVIASRPVLAQVVTAAADMETSDGLRRQLSKIWDHCKPKIPYEIFFLTAQILRAQELHDDLTTIACLNLACLYCSRDIEYVMPKGRFSKDEINIRTREVLQRDPKILSKKTAWSTMGNDPKDENAAFVLYQIELMSCKLNVMEKAELCRHILYGSLPRSSKISVALADYRSFIGHDRAEANVAEVRPNEIVINV